MRLHLIELRGATCHMGSHSVTFHPTQVNTPRLNPSQRPVLDIPTPKGSKAELAWVTSYIEMVYPHRDSHPSKYYLGTSHKSDALSQHHQASLVCM